MMNSLKSSRTYTQSQVFDLLGRALYECNVIELRLRWMHKHCGGIWTGKTPQELLESVKKAIEKQKVISHLSARLAWKCWSLFTSLAVTKIWNLRKNRGFGLSRLIIRLNGMDEHVKRR